MMVRLTAAINKLFFCYRISLNIRSFFLLVINTKKYRTSKQVLQYDQKKRPENIVSYNFIFNRAPKNIFLRTYTGDIDMFYEVLWKKVYSNPLLEWANTRTVVDLGANIGMTSLYFVRRFPTATVYAVEPDADNFKLLTANLSDEILQKRLFTLHAAISADNGIAYVQKKEKAYNSTISPEVTSGVQVRTINMSTLMGEMKISTIDILKIDIEGWEESLFAGETGWLKNIKSVVMECHSPSIREHCKSVLHSNGFLIINNPSDASSTDLLWAARS